MSDARGDERIARSLINGTRCMIAIVDADLENRDWGPYWKETDHVLLNCQCNGCLLRQYRGKLQEALAVLGSRFYHRTDGGTRGDNNKYLGGVHEGGA